MKNLLKNWKTTLAALLVIGGILAKCFLNGGDLIGCVQDQWPALTAAFGLLFAKDGNVTGV